MTASLLDDAMAHHIWATERLIDACKDLTTDQLTTPAPGTYGSILAILPGLTHYNLAISPLFAAVTLDFLDGQPQA